MWVGEEKIRLSIWYMDQFTGRARVLVVFCCILLVVAAVIVAIGFAKEVQARKALLQDELKGHCRRIAGQVNGDGLLSRPGR